ncbi:MAG: biopolymer transporter ExbD [Deltaproteobacteria bacterium]|nr:MAG: biopolymer transporter ExbD [Deltaproteobacteria bacterium]
MINISGIRRMKKKGVVLNIAPLIDMVFILLIFFLVTTSFIKETGVDINRPVAATAVKKKGQSILIGITRDGRIYMNRHEIDIRSVRANVERELAENPESSVIIVADRDSRTGIVITVMDECKLAGAKNVALAARTPSKE